VHLPVVLPKRVLECEGALATTPTKAKSSATRSRLAVLAGRCDRNPLSYDKSSVAELQALIRSKNLSPPDKAKSALVKALEDADDDATFHRLLDLPPELRMLDF